MKFLEKITVDSTEANTWLSQLVPEITTVMVDASEEKTPVADEPPVEPTPWLTKVADTPAAEPVAEPVAEPKVVDGPDASGADSGAANPANWVTNLQSGKTSEEIRQDAIALHDIVVGWQDGALRAGDIFQLLEANGGRYLEMHSPIILKNLSRSKLEKVAEICTRLAQSASIQ